MEDETTQLGSDKHYIIKLVEFPDYPKTDKEDDILKRLKRIEKLLQKLKDKNP